MENCTACGARLGPGRACPACGHPIEAPDLSDWRTDTAERPAIKDVPPAPRYPLYADEPADPVTAPPPAGPGGSGPSRGPGRGRRRWVLWVAGGAAVVLVAGLGTALLVGDSDDEPAADSPPATVAETTDPSDGATESPSGDVPPAQPTQTAGADIKRRPQPREPEDVAQVARIKVPATAPPSQGLDGTRTSYDAGNLVDGDRTTTWRMRGDGTGAELVIRFDRPTTITRVGLVNGYAKRARGPKGGVLDWYTGNRRVLVAAWVLDDGTVVRQRLSDSRRMQTTDVGAITTRRLWLRLVDVSAPGSGRAGRDYTAISELTVVGLPG